MSSDGRQCLSCGMVVDEGASTCPKCDAILGKQADGSIQTIDIAHHEETVEEATQKLNRAIDRHLRSQTTSLRVIVGHGRIHDGVQPVLNTLRARRRIREYKYEKGNRGAFLVKLK